MMCSTRWLPAGRAAIVLTSVLVVAACVSVPDRYFRGNTFVSKVDPPMQIGIAPDFEYLGPETFLLGTTHEAERHHWVRTENEKVTALIVLQFERILEGTDGQYEFNVPPKKYLAGSNYRFAPGPVRLGDHEYIHNTWAFDTKASAAQQPGRESDRTLQLLAANGYDIDAGLIMARWVRAVGQDARKEVIIFYMEPLSQHGYSIADFPERGAASEELHALSDKVVSRAGMAIEFP